MTYESKICIPMEGFVEKILDDSHVMLRITACRDENNIGRLILADPNYWRKIDNGTDGRIR